MLDINNIRDNREAVERALLKRLKPDDLDLAEIIRLDDERRGLIAQADELKALRNKSSKTKPTPETILELKKSGETIAELDNQLKVVEQALKQLLTALPNIPADDVVAGGAENNRVIKTSGKKPSFGFVPKGHVELATVLGLIDYERAVKMSGSGFWAYTGQGALLEWALLNYFIGYHRRHQDYQFMIPPYLLTEASAYTSGHLPKFKDDLFWTQDGTCLNATAEMMLGNYHRGEILAAEDLPKKYYAFSACFRREAGSYRTEERGMIRGHQFNKIEMFHYVRPEDSWTAFAELLQYAEELVSGLGLHYQTVQLAAGDASAAMAKTVDLEVWIPSMNVYKEVSSVSNALDFQARRGNVRYKNPVSGKNEFVHTLNGSGLATSRLLPAILEQYQQADGSVRVPKVLQKFLGKKIIKHGKG
ncbi:MAG: Serine-tRNA ligase 2 [Parcubacteria group bacterium GW2011_GWC2_45_15]|nr:MAG: Serine-tRNA ligase 2 [Parcubacteria group bacterium GW2011_GWC2_45_15]